MKQTIHVTPLEMKKLASEVLFAVGDHLVSRARQPETDISAEVEAFALLMKQTEVVMKNLTGVQPTITIDGKAICWNGADDGAKTSTIPEETRPTDDEPVLPEMQWRRFRPLTDDQERMQQFYSLVSAKGLVRKDIEMILSTLALNPETVEIDSPLIATAESIKATMELRKPGSEARSEMKEAKSNMKGKLTEAVVKLVLKHAQNRGELLIGINPDSTLGRDILKQNVLISELVDEVRLLRREMKGTRQKIDPNL